MRDGQIHEVGDVESEDAAALRRCAQELLLVAGMRRDPGLRRARDIVPELLQSLVYGAGRGGSIQVQARSSSLSENWAYRTG